jgi:hypothetical protein
MRPQVLTPGTNRKVTVAGTPEVTSGAWVTGWATDFNAPPYENPVEEIWAALKNYAANAAVSWPAWLRQIRSFFRTRSPGQILDTAAPWASP